MVNQKPLSTQWVLLRKAAVVGQLGKLRPIGNRPDPEGTRAFATGQRR
jgi:hypothetical protein